MSYILDALRRADSERERGAVPDIHAQPVPAVADDADTDGETGRGGTPTIVWLVVVLLLALIAWLLWQLLGRAEPHPGPLAPAVAAAPLPAAQPPAAQPPAALSPPATPQPQPPQGAAVAPALEPAPPLRLPAEPPAPQPPHPRAAAATAAPPAPTPALQPADAGGGRIHARHELPAHIQRELPQFTIGGSVYSEDPARRFVVINGSIVHEGDKPLPGLVLEQIKLKSAVLRYKDYRYEIGY